MSPAYSVNLLIEHRDERPVHDFCRLQPVIKDSLDGRQFSIDGCLCRRLGWSDEGSRLSIAKA